MPFTVIDRRDGFPVQTFSSYYAAIAYAERLNSGKTDAPYITTTDDADQLHANWRNTAPLTEEQS